MKTQPERHRQAARAAVAIALLAIVGLAWFLLYGPACTSVSRLFGNTLCSSKLTISDIRPLSFRAMVQAPDGRIRLFGYSGEAVPFAPTQVAVDIDRQAEIDRQPLPFNRIVYRMDTSSDGSRVAVACLTSNVCDALRPQGYVIDTASGKTLSPLETSGDIGRAFAGDTRPPIGLDADYLPDGIAAYPDPRTGGIELVKMPGRTLVARLTPTRQQELLGNPSTLAVRTSPSGRYAVVINNATRNTDIGTRLDVWDIEQKKMLSRIDLPRNLRIDTNAIWLRDETHIAGLRDLYSDDDPDAGVELYLLRLRQ